MASDIITYSSRHYQPNYAVKQECATAVSPSAAAGRDVCGFAVQDLSPSAPCAYWTVGGGAEQQQHHHQQQQPMTRTVGGHPAGSTASSASSSFADDESTSYEDITYSCGGYGPSTAAVALQAVADCEYGGLYGHLHLQQYGGVGSYYDGPGYHHQLHAGYDDKPPPYDNNNAADACDMNVAATAAAYDDAYGPTSAVQQFNHHQQRVQHNGATTDDDRETADERLELLHQQQCGGSSDAIPVGSVTVPVVRVVKRRNTANKKERRRTQSINNAFSDLRDCIPNVPADTKLSKIKTLRLATSYISYLMTVLDSDDPDTDGFKADLSAHTSRRSSAAAASRNKAALLQQMTSALNPLDNDRHHHQPHPHHKRSKGRTGWPQDVWALELKQEQV